MHAPLGCMRVVTIFTSADGAKGTHYAVGTVGGHTQLP